MNEMPGEGEKYRFNEPRNGRHADGGSQRQHERLTGSNAAAPVDFTSAQIFASLVFDLSYFYAIVADFHMRVPYLFFKPRYSVLMSSHLSRSRAVRGIRQRIK
jgi:hypothetical protein